MSKWKIAGCVREDGEWHHLPTRTGAKGFVSTWDISKEILDIAERALELLGKMPMLGDLDWDLDDMNKWSDEREALLAECDGDGEKSGIQWRGVAVEDLTPLEKRAMMEYCEKHPVFQMDVEINKPKQPTVANQMDPCDEWASLIILADEIDKLKGQLEKDDL